MEKNKNLYNATVIGENPDTAFIIDGDHLHAVESSLAHRQANKSDPKQIIPLMHEALKALIKYSNGKVEPHFLEVDLKSFASRADEQEQLVLKIHHIFSHLPHHDRNELSSMVHHKQTASSKKTR